MVELIQCLVSLYGVDSKLFWVAEPFKNHKSCHVHALIKIKESPALLKNSILKAWHTVAKPGGYGKHNLASVEAYKQGKGAHYYVAKYLQMDNIDYDLMYLPPK